MDDDTGVHEPDAGGRQEKVLHDAGADSGDRVGGGRLGWLWRPTGLAGWVLVGVVVLLVGLASGQLLSLLLTSSGDGALDPGLWVELEPAAAIDRSEDATDEAGDQVEEAEDRAEDAADEAEDRAEDAADEAEDRADDSGGQAEADED